MAGREGYVRGYQFAQLPFEMLEAGLLPRALIVFAYLSKHASSDRRAFPSRAALVRETKLSRATVDRALDELRDGGWMTVEHCFSRTGSQTVNTYWLYPCVPKAGVLTGEQGGTHERVGGVLTHEYPKELEPDELEPENYSLAPAVRKRDLVFEQVAEACGIDWHRLTPSARGPLVKAVSELKLVEADPEDIAARAAEFHRRWPEVTLTPTALAKHWPSLDHDPAQRTFRTNLLEILEERRSERVRGSKDLGPDALDVPSYEADDQGDPEALDREPLALGRHSGMEGPG